jgi:hypothetical protein
MRTKLENSRENQLPKCNVPRYMCRHTLHQRENSLEPKLKQCDPLETTRKLREWENAML